MGAGCYFTNDLTGDKAGFINLSLLNGDAEDDDSLNFYLQDIAEILTRCGYDQDNSDDRLFTNGLLKLRLSLNYHNLVLYFDSFWPEYSYYSGQPDPRYFLAKANLHRAENKVWRELSKEGYTICVAETGYTCREVKF